MKELKPPVQIHGRIVLQIRNAGSPQKRLVMMMTILEDLDILCEVGAKALAFLSESRSIFTTVLLQYFKDRQAFPTHCLGMHHPSSSTVQQLIVLEQYNLSCILCRSY